MAEAAAAPPAVRRLPANRERVASSRLPPARHTPPPSAAELPLTVVRSRRSCALCTYAAPPACCRQAGGGESHAGREEVAVGGAGCTLCMECRAVTSEFAAGR